MSKHPREVTSSQDVVASLFSRRAVLGGLASVCFGARFSTPAISAEYGSFRGTVVAEWLPDGRNMRLVQPFEYVGPDGRRWPVPSGVVVDGASIPSVFWSIIGGPFEGRYRAPSVVHDYYCGRRTRPYQDVHQNFHNAMLCAGVSTQKAWLMFQAVTRFGPQWADPKVPAQCEIVDENYNFELCARNFSRPSVRWVKVERRSLLDFIDEAGGKADPADLEKLRIAIEALK